MRELQVMVDMETLGTTADAVIMSIGAVKFDLATGEIQDNGFYASISVESNLEYGRRITENTLIWWMAEAPAQARKVFAEPKQPLGEGLEALSEWVDDPDTVVWSNGATFDIPMLEHAYQQLGWETPWKFFNTRCYRTFANLPQIKAAGIKKPTAQHNALQDAVDQAKTLILMHRVLTGAKPKVASKAKA